MMNDEEGSILAESEKYIARLCKNRWTDIPPEDRLSEAMLHLLYALRTYPTDSQQFLAMFERTLERHMKEQCKAYRGQLETHYVSFDVHYADTAEDLYNCFPSPQSDETRVEVDLFLASLTTIERNMIDDLFRCKDKERKDVAAKYGYTRKDMESALKNLYKRYTEGNW